MWNKIENNPHVDPKNSLGRESVTKLENLGFRLLRSKRHLFEGWEQKSGKGSENFSEISERVTLVLFTRNFSTLSQIHLSEERGNWMVWNELRDGLSGWWDEVLCKWWRKEKGRKGRMMRKRGVSWGGETRFGGSCFPLLPSASFSSSAAALSYMQVQFNSLTPSKKTVLHPMYLPLECSRRRVLALGL